MKEQFLLSIIILVLMISCKQSETKKTEIYEEVTNSKLIIETEIKVEENTKQEQFIENDSLAFAFKSELENYAINSPFFKIEVKPYQNQHDKNVIDTIKTLTFDKTTLEFYKAQNWESMIGGIIINSEIEFLDSLEIGIKKRPLEKILKTKITSDQVVLGNLEQSCLFYFQFENGILESIKFEGYFD